MGRDQFIANITNFLIKISSDKLAKLNNLLRADNLCPRSRLIV
jgi:hypothetical protein